MAGKLLTEPAIAAALRDVKRGKASRVLSDPAPRGAGRLLLVVKPDRAEWYARRFVDGRQRKTKIGSYPRVSLAEARRLFSGAVERPVVERSATFGALADGYLESLRAAGKPSVKQAERVLALAAGSIGRSKLARDVTPADVAAAIRPVYERGARVQADKVRMYVGAAFRWGFQAAHDYRAAQPVDWGILSNPVEAVPRDTEAERVGSRFLSEAELVALLTWARLGRSRSRKAIALLALTGQRVREVVEIKSSQWDRSGRLLSWARTKNGKPHVLPVCEEAAAILDSLRPDADGWLFPALGGRPGPMRDAAVLKALKAYARWAGVPAFSGRDLRRTWKTLAGKAGLTKTERDLLQNHGAGDVSSRHYDRFDYLPEKRAAVARWAAWLQEQVREHRAKKRADHVVDGKQEKNGQGVAAV